MLLDSLQLPERSSLRAAIDAATRRAEPACLHDLLPLAELDAAAGASARELATTLVTQLRAARTTAGGVDALMREFSLSSDEGVALMCLAEALLRIPDQATADALIRDKLARGNWRAHVGNSPSLFVNAAAWGLLVSGQLVATHSEEGLGSALARLLARGGEPLIRKGVDLALRLLGRQFVTGETIAEALARAREHEARGYRYSYDMLGEAALTDADARRYFASYEAAIHAIGAASAGRGVVAGPGISVKLSALHPRYAFAQRDRVVRELLPRLRHLCLLAQRHDIGLAIDAEESERLSLALDLVEALLVDPQFAAWRGLGVVVQAYQKRAPFVIDWLIDAARRARRHVMVRLVKGAYWDSEIKRAQVEGQSDYPVFTRKVFTDVSYLACARKLLAASDVVFAQLATHNALTLATVLQMARAARAAPETWEFQCLHGMGESLYDQVVGAAALDRPCRVYAPVGTHETLLAYLVRRLLENGANSSFVHRIVDPNVGVAELVADPVAATRATGGAPHPLVPLPAQMFGAARRNSQGLDLNDEATLRALAADFARLAQRPCEAAPMLATSLEHWPAPPPTHSASDAAGISERERTWRAVINPATGWVLGRVADASAADVESALAAAQVFASTWAETSATLRAELLERAASLFEANRAELMDLAVREAGKTLANALGEVREAVDFLRYYAQQAREAAAVREGRGWGQALGPVACISPWNFPLAIFTGQIGAALAAGNVVLAKPAEQTPLIAAAAVRLLRAAGVPAAALQLLPGDGRVGAMLTSDARVRAVVFTGSTEVAALIDRALAARAGDEEIPLIAETGGCNAMIVDSSALPEQAVADVVSSAFDSAGQRCSALRVLCLQDDIADRTLAMLRGAMAELRIGDPGDLRVDVGPVIDGEAQSAIERYLGAQSAQHVARWPLPVGPDVNADSHPTFVAPTIVELPALVPDQREVFGPVLHVLRWRRSELAALTDAINATGFGLTLGIHSRIDETIDAIVARARVGNIYVNRNMIGAVVGVQPFGGEGRSGTGPKAGGPWYLPRLRCNAAPPSPSPSALRQAAKVPASLLRLRDWAHRSGHGAIAARCDAYARETLLGAQMDLPGPTGESNSLSWHSRGRALCLARDERALLAQLAAVLASGNEAIIADDARFDPLCATLRDAVALPLTRARAPLRAACELVLHDADAPSLAEVRKSIAAHEGARVRVVHARLASDGENNSERDESDKPPALGVATMPTSARAAYYPLFLLLAERTVSVNTAAAGGNASLMTLAPI